MDTRLKSLTLLTLILLASDSDSVSEARPLLLSNINSVSSSGKDGIVGVFRTLKSSGPSPGIGHRVKKLQNHQNLAHIAESGPSPGIGHKLQKFGKKKDSAGPSPGIGHRVIINNKLQNLGERKDSGPSPGGGGH